MIDKSFTNARFIQVSQLPREDSHLTAELYVDEATSYRLDELSLLRLDPDEKLKPDEQDSINPNSFLTPPKTIIEIPTKSYVDSLHEINRNRQDLSSLFNDQDNEFNKSRIIKLDSVTVDGDPSSDNELANKKHIDDELDKNTVLRFNRTLQNYLRDPVGNDVHNLAKYDKRQITDITFIKFPNNGGHLLHKRKTKCNDKNNSGKLQNFIKSTETSSPTGDSGLTSLPTMGDSFMYLETSSNNHGKNVLFSCERFDIIIISNITFYYNRLSILTNDSLKSMNRFRIQ